MRRHTTENNKLKGKRIASKLHTRLIVTTNKLPLHKVTNYKLLFLCFSIEIITVWNLEIMIIINCFSFICVISLGDISMYLVSQIHGEINFIVLYNQFQSWPKNLPSNVAENTDNRGQQV